MMMMMMRRTAMTGTTTRRTLQVRTQSSPCMPALSAMPSAQAQRRSPKPAILWTNLHPRRQTSTCACSVQLSSVHSSVNISRSPNAHHSPRRSYTPFRLEEDVGDGGATALLRHYLRCSLPVPLSSSPARTYIHKAITLLYTLPRRHSALDVIATHPGLIAVASLHIEPPLARWQRRHGGDYHLRLLLDGHAPSHLRRCGYPPRLDHLLRCALDSPGAVRGLMRGRRALSFGHGYGQASDTQTCTRVFWPAARHRLALVHARSQTEGLTGVFCTSAGVGVGGIGVEALAPLGIFLLYSR